MVGKAFMSMPSAGSLYLLIVTMTGLQQEHNIHCSHQLNQCSICPSGLGHRRPHDQRRSGTIMWCLHTLSLTARCKGHTS